MDSTYSQALRGIRADGVMGDFLKEATSVLDEAELRAIVGAAGYELEKYKKFKAHYHTNHAMKALDGKRICDFTDFNLDLALARRYSMSKTMVKALKKERKRRKKNTVAIIDGANTY